MAAVEIKGLLLNARNIAFVSPIAVKVGHHEFSVQCLAGQPLTFRFATAQEAEAARISIHASINQS